MYLNSVERLFSAFICHASVHYVSGARKVRCQLRDISICSSRLRVIASGPWLVSLPLSTPLTTLHQLQSQRERSIASGILEMHKSSLLAGAAVHQKKNIVSTNKKKRFSMRNIVGTS